MVYSSNQQVSEQEKNELSEAVSQYSRAKTAHQKACTKLMELAALDNHQSTSAIAKVLHDTPTSDASQALYKGLAQVEAQQYLLAMQRRRDFQTKHADKFTWTYNLNPFKKFHDSHLYTFKRTVWKQPGKKFLGTKTEYINDQLTVAERDRAIQDFKSSGAPKRHFAEMENAHIPVSFDHQKDEFTISKDDWRSADTDFNGWKKRYRKEMKEQNNTLNDLRKAKGLPPEKLNLTATDYELAYEKEKGRRAAGSEFK